MYHETLVVYHGTHAVSNDAFVVGRMVFVLHRFALVFGCTVVLVVVVGCMSLLAPAVYHDTLVVKHGTPVVPNDALVVGRMVFVLFLFALVFG